MKHIAEDDLIAYQLRENVDTADVRVHLVECAQCAAQAESIAETLRVFSAEPVPQIHGDHVWQRMRGSLPALRKTARRRWWQHRPVWGVPILAAVLCLAFVAPRYNVGPKAPAYAHHRQGPLTQQPVAAASDAGITNHLDSAERLLTEVNHTAGPLDESTRIQARTLLLTNAVYVQQAHVVGNLAEASLLEQLGRVLTTLEHQSGQSSQDKGWHIRFEMSTDGLLLDLRILQENDQRNSPRQEDAK